FDISSNNPATILASKQTIAKTTPWFAGALQTGPDLKIYMAMWKDTAVSVIENPDIYGPGCNFSYNKIYIGTLAQEAVQFGLPTFIQSYFDTTANPYDFSRVGNCSELSVTFKINRINGIDSVKWDFGDGQNSQILQPTNTYAGPGFYDVRLIVYKIDCSGLNDTINRRIWIADSPIFLGKDTASCEVLKLDLGIDELPGFNYIWNTGHVGGKITTTTNGLYWLEIEQNGCKMRDSINISTKPPPSVNLGPDTSACLGARIMLSAANTIADSYLWNTGETTTVIIAEKPGTYYVTVTESTCTGSDTLVVFPGDCEVFVPSAFTPNNDGRNDNFGAANEFAFRSFKIQVYSKWGQLVFEAFDNAKKWDGTFKGKNMPNGAYLWMIDYINSKGRKKYLQGTVLLIR
ncbi:MAG TPA: gliding motility-associated C-terminal domain-containing protein, partial [Saprospiraceae bacterium]|nr:gliding motility-associated C-terminal domain-containing protein [Saprospiraceae bacterium]